MKKRIMIVGCSGHARVICDVIRAQAQNHVIGFVDNKVAPGTLVDGLPVLGNDLEIDLIVRKHNIDGYIIGIGDNFIRELVTHKFVAKAPCLELVTAIHPSAYLAVGVKIGPGSVVMAQAVLNVGSSVAEGCVINTSASVDHDCSLGSYSTVAPGAVLGGNCDIGDRVFVGLGANICHGRSIGHDSVVGAGSLVLEDIGNLQIAFGNPARFIRSRKTKEKYL